MSATPKVSVIVVTYNSASQIEACLASIADETGRISLEVVVADNASGDDTLARVRAAATGPLGHIDVIELADNLGFATACNRAAVRAQGEYLLLLNPDARLLPRAIPELVAAIERDRGVGICGPGIIDDRGAAELSWGPMVSFIGEAWQKTIGRLAVDWRSYSVGRPAWVSGACLLIPRAVWAELSGMDEAFFLYFEDVDLCARVRATGRDVLYWPHATVAHTRGSSAASNRRRVAIEYRRSQLHFYRKHFGREAHAILAASLIARLTIEAGWATFRGRWTDAALCRDVRAAVRDHSAEQS